METGYKGIILIFLFMAILLSTSVSFATDNSSISIDNSKQQSNIIINTVVSEKTEISDNIQHIKDLDDDEKISTYNKANNKTSLKNAQSNNNITTYTQLKEVINDNKTRSVTLQPITYYADESIRLSRHDLTINGNGAIIDGQSTYNFINFASNNLILRNLTIKNFRTSIESAITISSKSTADIINCTFMNNTGQTYGASILNRNNLNLINSTFENNKATYGSAVRSIGNSGNIIIENCTFKNNPITARYGVEHNERDSILHFTGHQLVSINNCTFSNNTGRCIHNYLEGHITITNNNFINMDKKLNEEDSSLGSIISNYEANLFLYHNTFKNISITAPRIGGGFIYNEIAEFELLNNTFTNITLTQTGKNSRIAGGIFWNRNSTAQVENNTFNIKTNSYNLYGAAVYNNIGVLYFTNNTVILDVNAQNEVGGAAVYNDMDEELDISSKLYLGDNSFGQIKISSKANILNKTVRSRGNLIIIGLEDTDTLIRTAITTIKAPESIVTGKKAQFIIRVTDNSTHGPINGTTIIKIDGLTLKDANDKVIKLNVKNGTAILDYFLTGYSARSYNITAVFSKNGYYRSEAYTTMRVNRTTYRFTPFTINATSEMEITINTTVRDYNWNIVSGNNKVAIKIQSKTILSTTVTNGTLYAKIKLPYLPAGILNVTMLFGKNYRYEFLQINSTANISKQSVVIDIKNVTAKAGDKITLQAILKNYITKTDVISGKYIFKVNGVTVPLITNNKTAYTTKQISHGVARWDYTLPSNIRNGTYFITVSYNGNSQSNPAKHSARVLRIVN